MSVIVKGMKMPKSCKECKFSWWDVHHLYCEADGKPWGLEVTDYTDKRHPSCPIIEVPEEGILYRSLLLSQKIQLLRRR